MIFLDSNISQCGFRGSTSAGASSNPQEVGDIFCQVFVCQDGLVFNVSASHGVGRGFASLIGHTKDLHKNGTNCLPGCHAGVRIGV